ncbi:MAG: conjugative transfer signal peptidase TraF [Sulfurovaceae bacterium]|nr:conjugative transfer signal peptidase TraF [Sulfurovaceae bacterium]
MKNTTLKNTKFMLYIAFFIIASTLFAIIWKSYNLTLNLTHSFPIGIYQIDQVHQWQKGDLVVVCPPNNDKFSKNNHHYIVSGRCSTGTAPLLKKIAATAGDLVAVSDFVYINNIKQKNSRVYKYNGFTKMYPCAGRHLVTKGFVWLMSDYNERSFDSRYFCEVPAANIIGRAKLLIEF